MGRVWRETFDSDFVSTSALWVGNYAPWKNEPLSSVVKDGHKSTPLFAVCRQRRAGHVHQTVTAMWTRADGATTHARAVPITVTYLSPAAEQTFNLSYDFINLSWRCRDPYSKSVDPLVGVIVQSRDCDNRACATQRYPKNVRCCCKSALHL